MINMPLQAIVEYRDVPHMPDVKGFQIIDRSRRAIQNQLCMMAIQSAALNQEFVYRGPSPVATETGDQFIARGYIRSRTDAEIAARNRG